MISELTIQINNERNIMEAGKNYIGVGAGAVILNDKKEILLLKRLRNPEIGKWSIPGGKIDFLEKAESAVIREMEEELGIKVEIKKLLGLTSHILTENKEHWLAPAYLVKIVEGIPKNMEPEKHEEIQWFSLNNLPKNLTITTVKAVEYLKSNNK
jgi:mutator protein MutT